MKNAEVIKIGNSLFNKNFPILSEKAKQRAIKNRNLFIKDLNKTIDKELKEAEIKKFALPNVQYSFTEAIITIAKDYDKLKSDILAQLLVNIVKSKRKELKEIIYSEAIPITSKLTKTQFKILALISILTHTIDLDIKNFRDFKEYLYKNIFPMLDTKLNRLDLLHLEYTGCVSIGRNISGTQLLDFVNKLTSIFFESYTYLFFNDEILEIKVEEINKLELPKKITSKIFEKKTENGYKFKTTSEIELRNYLISNRLITYKINLILELFHRDTWKVTEVEKYLIKEIPEIKKLLSYWNTLKTMFVSPVGLALGLSYYKLNFENELDIDKIIY